jgi:TusA-related sulfurtransferase
LFKAWRVANIGDVIELRAIEPTIERDVRAWARKSGNKILEVTQDNYQGDCGHGYDTYDFKSPDRLPPLHPCTQPRSP